MKSKAFDVAKKYFDRQADHKEKTAPHEGITAADVLSVWPGACVLSPAEAAESNGVDIAPAPATCCPRCGEPWSLFQNIARRGKEPLRMGLCWCERDGRPII